MARVEIDFIGFAAKLKAAAEQGIASLNKVSAVAKKHQASLQKIQIGAAIALAGEIMLVKQLVSAYEKQEQADVALLQAMKNRGIYTKEAFEDTKKFSSAMQDLTKYGDEEITMAQMLLITIGKLEGDALKEATKATLDLAEAKKMDLRSAADMVSKSIGGTINVLARYGLKIKEGVTDPTERARLIVEQISLAFGGQATVAAGTYTGQLKQLNNQIGDLKEDLGKAILPMLIHFANILKKHLPDIRNWVQSHESLIGIIVGGGMAGTGLIMALAQLALAFTNPVTGTIATVVLATIAIMGLLNALAGVKSISRNLPSDLGGTNEAIASVKEELVEAENAAVKWATISGVTGGSGGAGVMGMVGNLIGIRAGGAAKNMQNMQKYLIQLEEHKKRLEAIVGLEQMQQDIADQLQASGVDENGEAIEIENPNIIFPTDITEESLAVQEERQLLQLEMVNNQYGLLTDADKQYKQGIIDRFGVFSKKTEAQWDEHVRKSNAKAELFGWGLYSILDTAFSKIADLNMSFGNAILSTMASVLQGLFNMIVDAAVQEIIADEIKTVAKLMIQGVFDWSALGKIARVTMIAGAAKATLGALVGSFQSSLGGGSRYMYGGRLPSDGWYYGEAGEIITNPQEPLDSALNSGSDGVVSMHWHQHGPIRSRNDVKKYFKEFGEEIVYSQQGRRMATI